MTDTIQKLREALQAVIAAHDAEMKELGERMHAANLKTLRVDIQAAIDMFSAIEQARQAIALPTAEQVDDINVAESFTSVTKTAPPVGERELFEREAVQSGYSVDKYAGTSIYADISTARAYEWWQSGRAALSAGDAVDAVDAQRYRWLMDNCTLGIKQNGVGWSLNTTACIAPDCIKDVGATIDAAMRKGQL